MTEEEVEEHQHATPLRSDFGISGFQPHALDLHTSNLGSGEEGSFTIALVMMTRQEGRSSRSVQEII